MSPQIRLNTQIHSQNPNRVQKPKRSRIKNDDERDFYTSSSPGTAAPGMGQAPTLLANSFQGIMDRLRDPSLPLYVKAILNSMKGLKTLNLDQKNQVYGGLVQQLWSNVQGDEPAFLDALKNIPAKTISTQQTKDELLAYVIENKQHLLSAASRLGLIESIHSKWLKDQACLSLGQDTSVEDGSLRYRALCQLSDLHSDKKLSALEAIAQDPKLSSEIHEQIQKDIKALIPQIIQRSDVRMNEKYALALKIVDKNEQSDALFRLLNHEQDLSIQHIQNRLRLFTQDVQDLVYRSLALTHNWAMEMDVDCAGMVDNIKDHKMRDSTYATIALNPNGILADPSVVIRAAKNIQDVKLRDDVLYAIVECHRAGPETLLDLANNIIDVDRKQEAYVLIARLSTQSINSREQKVYQVLANTKARLAAYDGILDARSRYPGLKAEILAGFLGCSFENNNSALNSWFDLVKEHFPHMNIREKEVLFLGFSNTISSLYGQPIRLFIPAILKAFENLLKIIDSDNGGLALKHSLMRAMLKANLEDSESFYQQLLLKTMPLGQIRDYDIEDFIKSVLKSDTCTEKFFETTLALYMPLDDISQDTKEKLIHATAQHTTLSEEFLRKKIVDYVEDEIARADYLYILEHPDLQRFKTKPVSDAS